MAYPHADGSGGFCRFLPVAAHTRQEAIARSRRLGEPLVAPAAVPADGRGRHQHSRRCVQAGERLGQQSRTVDAAVGDAPLLLSSPALRSDRLAGEVHDGVESLQGRPVYAAALGIPPHSRSGVGAAACGTSSHQRRCLVPFGGEALQQRPPYEPCGTGYRYSHVRQLNRAVAATAHRRRRSRRVRCSRMRPAAALPRAEALAPGAVAVPCRSAGAGRSVGGVR